MGRDHQGFYHEVTYDDGGVDSIWVIVERLTKVVHFISISESIFAKKLAYIYVQEVVFKHGVSVSVVSDRDVHFTSRF